MNITPNPFLIIPKIPVTLRTDIKKLDALPDKVERALELIVEKYAFAMKELAQFYVPVDQGAAKASIYVATRKSSGKESAYAEASSHALTRESRHGHKGRTLTFAFDDPEENQIKHLHALICVGVSYGLELELGEYTMHATNPGARHPYLGPAVEHYTDDFYKACGEVFKHLGKHL